ANAVVAVRPLHKCGTGNHRRNIHADRVVSETEGGCGRNGRNSRRRSRAGWRDRGRRRVYRKVDYLHCLTTCRVIRGAERWPVEGRHTRLARPPTSIANDDTVSDKPLNVLVEGVGWRYVLKGLPAHRLIEACGQRDYLSDLCPRAVIAWLEAGDVEDA